ncbi:hypothetical protein CR513_16513, partial [Mucuna pruriens]
MTEIRAHTEKHVEAEEDKEDCLLTKKAMPTIGRKIAHKAFCQDKRERLTIRSFLKGTGVGPLGDDCEHEQSRSQARDRSRTLGDRKHKQSHSQARDRSRTLGRRL